MRCRNCKKRKKESKKSWNSSKKNDWIRIRNLSKKFMLLLKRVCSWDLMDIFREMTFQENMMKTKE